VRRLIGLTMVIVAVLVACGVPGPGPLEEIDGQDVPWGLASTTSTTITTTTSTTTTTTIPSPTTTLLAPTTTSTTVPETSTTVAAVTVPTDLFFVSGGGLFRISPPLVEDADVDIILFALLQGPEAYPEISGGLRSAIPDEASLDADVIDGVVVVDVPAILLDEMSSEDLRLMFGQIVMTFTSPRCIGLVRFTFDGDPQQRVFLGDFSTSEPGQALSCSDYSQLVTNDATVSPTTVPGSAPATDPPQVSSPDTGTTVP
jgi:hypothetical protein